MVYIYIFTWKSTCYIFNSLIFRLRVVYRIPNLAAAQRHMCNYHMNCFNFFQGGVFASACLFLTNKDNAIFSAAVGGISRQAVRGIRREVNIFGEEKISVPPQAPPPPPSCDWRLSAADSTSQRERRIPYALQYASSIKLYTCPTKIISNCCSTGHSCTLMYSSTLIYTHQHSCTTCIGTLM